MAYDKTSAERLRFGLAGEVGVYEQAMFGGLCFMVSGHMTAGVGGPLGGYMFRVGKERQAEALAIDPLVNPMMMGGRQFGGMVELPYDGPDEAVTALLLLALKNAKSLPPKTPKVAKKKAPKNA